MAEQVEQNKVLSFLDAAGNSGNKAAPAGVVLNNDSPYGTRDPRSTDATGYLTREQAASLAAGLLGLAGVDAYTTHLGSEAAGTLLSNEKTKAEGYAVEARKQDAAARNEVIQRADAEEARTREGAGRTDSTNLRTRDANLDASTREALDRFEDAYVNVLGRRRPAGTSGRVVGLDSSGNLMDVGAWMADDNAMRRVAEAFVFPEEFDEQVKAFVTNAKLSPEVSTPLKTRADFNKFDALVKEDKEIAKFLRDNHVLDNYALGQRRGLLQIPEEYRQRLVLGGTERAYPRMGIGNKMDAYIPVLDTPEGKKILQEIADSRGVWLKPSRTGGLFGRTATDWDIEAERLVERLKRPWITRYLRPGVVGTLGLGFGVDAALGRAADAWYDDSIPNVVPFPKEVYRR